jgi:Na+/H+ antiporter
MGTFELVIAMLFVGALLALWANRVGVPYPALLALGGAVLALVPGTPDVILDPQLALALFVAPTLLDAAYDASPRDLRANLAPLVSLAGVMILLTVAAVAWAVRLVLPAMEWAPAIALGAIVAPPDAGAASAVLRRLRLPHRLLVILEGESLFNDATALLIFRIAVGAAVTATFSGWNVLPTLALTCGGGVATGWLLARVQIWTSARVEDLPINVLLQFLGTFAVWLLAEKLGLSAIITVVVFAMTLSRRVSGSISARQRMVSYAVWEVAVLVLNVLAFVLIGLQLRSILSQINGAERGTYFLAAGTVCIAVIVVRIVWVMLHTAIDVWRIRRFGNRSPNQTAPTFGSGLLASWCGMRGIVSLAAALALPKGFSHRDVIILCAFSVVLTTLVLQGMTLRPLIKKLGLRDDGSVEREVLLARSETARAAMRVLDGHTPRSHAADMLSREYELRLGADSLPPQDAADENAVTLPALHLRTVSTQREVLADLRKRGVIGDAAFHLVEEELDLLELTGALAGAAADGERRRVNVTRAIPWLCSRS